MKIAVIGAGAIGSLFGAFLSKAGHDVTLIVKKKNAQIIRHKGLTVKSPHKKNHVKVNVLSKINNREDFDTVLLTVKAYDTVQAVMAVKPLIKGGTSLICLQNGLTTEEAASKIVGKYNVLRGVTNCGAFLKEPGFVIHTGQGDTIVGELDGGITSRAETVAETFTKAGLQTKVTKNINGAVWVKTLVNAGINPIGALTKMTNGELLESEVLRKLMIDAVKEGSIVAKRAGVKLENDPVPLMLNTAKLTAHNINSMLQDIERGKLTEIDYINGAIFRSGERLNISTPINRLLTYLIKGLELKRRGPN
ncbi:MAG: 2-dehydropantoate 2-reductase [Candidatus Bathyarchaeota archaeon]